MPSLLLSASLILLVSAVTIASPAVKDSSANKTATSWACPEYTLAFNFASIARYDGINSWEECGRLCHETEFCSHWSWQPPRSTNQPRGCWLKNSSGDVVSDCNVISGVKACYTH